MKPTQITCAKLNLACLGLFFSGIATVSAQHASLAAGSGNVLNSQTGVVLAGVNNTTSVPNTLAVGSGNTLGYPMWNSILVGDSNTGYALGGYLFGYGHYVNQNSARTLMAGELHYHNVGANCAVFGYDNEVYGSQNLVTGYQNYFGGDNSFISGKSHSGTGNEVTIIGTANVMRTHGGAVIGDHLYNVSYKSLIVGRYNAFLATETSGGWGGPSTPSETQWRSDDSLFVVGYGSAENDRKNAFVIRKSGEATFTEAVISQNSPVVTQTSLASGTLPGTLSALTIKAGGAEVAWADATRKITTTVTNTGNETKMTKVATGGTTHIEEISAPTEAKLVIKDSDSSVTISSNGVISGLVRGGDLEMGEFTPP
jgi:hypothetical protein